MKKASKITDVERSEIEILHNKGYSARSIASALGRSPNTIAAELKRNSYKDGRYVSTRAKHKAYVRRKYAKYQGKKIADNDELRSFIIAKLKEHWSPNEIAGFMKRHQACSGDCIESNCSNGLRISKTAIYEWLRSAPGQQYCQYLYSRRYSRKPRKKNRPTRVMIPTRTGIEKRPRLAQDRVESGHWEYDSVVSSKCSGSKAAMAVMIERSSRLVLAKLVPNLKPRDYANTLAKLSEGLKLLSFTTDNGIENKEHQTLTQQSGAQVYFTDPYSSWQKGSVENANKMLRFYFPKGTDFSKVKQTDVDEALTRINNKPRKILGYKSSLQVAKEQGIILEEVS